MAAELQCKTLACPSSVGLCNVRIHIMLYRLSSRQYFLSDQGNPKQEKDSNQLSHKRGACTSKSSYSCSMEVVWDIKRHGLEDHTLQIMPHLYGGSRRSHRQITDVTLYLLSHGCLVSIPLKYPIMFIRATKQANSDCSCYQLHLRFLL